MTEFTIGEISQKARVQASTIRYYESIKLMPVPQRVSGQRRYGAETIKRLSFIKLAQQAGFTIAEIKLLLEGFDKADKLIPSSSVPPLSHWRKLASQKLIELEAIIHQAQQMKHLLQEGLSCGCLDFNECYRLITALE